jgi:hypothetical protein
MSPWIVSLNPPLSVGQMAAAPWSQSVLAWIAEQLEILPPPDRAR